MAERTRNRVLLVEDEAVIRMAVRKFLTAAGFEIVEAENRATAMSKIRAHRPDAVILSLLPHQHDRRPPPAAPRTTRRHPQSRGGDARARCE